MSAQPLKVALLGAGGRGRAVIVNWVKIADAHVAAVVDPSEDSLAKTRAHLHEHFGQNRPDAIADTEYVADVAGWLQRAQVDVVTINSWDPQHAPNAIDCFNAGLNVHVAKPMTQSTEQADAVYAAWKQSGAIGVVDMQLRTSLLVEKAMALIHGNAIGRVRLINCVDYVGRGGVEFRNTRSRRRDMIRSWTLAKGVHFLDLLNLFMGSDPVRVYASAGRDVYGGTKPNDLHCNDCDECDTCFFEGSTIRIGGMPYGNPNAGCVFSEEIDITDNCAAVIDYAHGGRASYTECYFTPEYQTTYEIIGDRGALFVRYAMDNRLYLEHRKLGAAEATRIPIYASGAHGDGDERIIAQMADALREGRPMHPDIRDGRQAVALCEAIDRSADTGQPVMVPPLPALVPGPVTR